MNTLISGPIIYVEDDEDDQFLFQTTIAGLNISNEIRMFSNGKEFLDYLCVTNEKPFLIFCDINMPVMNGLNLRKHIIKDDFLRKKSIPFVFYTTGVSDETVELAYDLIVQGFFQKVTNMADMHSLIESIIDYWKTCKHPNNQ